MNTSLRRLGNRSDDLLSQTDERPSMPAAVPASLGHEKGRASREARPKL
jgi:hypothetical protein